MSKSVILTGIRANNDLTIGNYFGAILPTIDMARERSDEFQINLFVPDLHSFTTPIDHYKLQEQILHNVRLFVAAGLPLDKPDIHVYRQSYVSAHSELTWILDCFTGFGEMSRMTQFKDKSGIQKLPTGEADSFLQDKAWDDARLSQAKEMLSLSLVRKTDASVGLFNYPVLMAADILLYGATYVPVGDDQSQHLEFTRDIAERLNSKFELDLFTVPKAVKEQHAFFGKDQGLRIKDLQHPTKKMSKSDDSGKGVLFLGDTPESAHKKIMSAATDSLASVNLDWDNQPGISNLLQLLGLFTHRSIDSVTAEWQGIERYGDFKRVVADAAHDFLTNLQTNLAKVDDTQILTKLESSEKAMNIQANATLLSVQKAVGLR
jgi:tryptophanyl-tRNA synthetase